jgi:integrase
MSVRKRTWKNKDGERSAWVVNYVDGTGKGHLKTFKREKDAKAWEVRTKVEVMEGRHTPDSASITVREAGENWIRKGASVPLERTTLDQYRYLLDRHIVPYLGNVKLSKLTTLMVVQFRTKLQEGMPAPGEDVGKKRTPYTVKRVISALSSLIADAQEDSTVAQNVVRSLASRKKKGKGKAQQKRKLVLGVHIPKPDEVKAILGAAEGRWRPLLMTAAMTGLRASELRGLRWANVDLEAKELHVRERADFYNDLGAPKSEAGDRTVPLPDVLVSTLRRWKLACPNGPLGLAFPNTVGKVENRGHIVDRGWWPAQIAAGVCNVVKDEHGKDVLNEKGEPVRKAKYLGLHCLRHYFARWCISKVADGGLELPAKEVQELMGHSTITMTMDTYGGLFPKKGDGSARDKSAAALVG